MRIKTATLLIALLALAPVRETRAEEAPALRSGNAIFDKAVEIVLDNFYAPTELGRFRDAVGLVASSYPDLAAADQSVVGDAIDFALASLRASHTARYTRDTVDYYELTDIFRHAVRDSLRRLFPPDGEVAYPGVGLATVTSGGKVFITDVYDHGPADRAGLGIGDEIVSVDGAPFAAIDSFRDKVGKTAVFAVRRTETSDPSLVSVSVEMLQPTETFLEAIRGSAEVVDRSHFKVGYLRIWAYAAPETEDVIRAMLAGPLAEADGLVLDLRGRWGGAPADAADMFVGGSPDMVMRFRNDGERLVNFRWRKPAVAIIDEGTRSGMEILAYALKENGVRLIGAKTAGAVVAGRGYMLPDDSLMILAVADVLVDGGRLEGQGVMPDVAVPFDSRYADGADPQKEAAFAEMERGLSRGAFPEAKTP